MLFSLNFAWKRTILSTWKGKTTVISIILKLNLEMGNWSIDTTVSYFDGPIFFFFFINYPVITCNIKLFPIFILNMYMLRVPPISTNFLLDFRKKWYFLFFILLIHWYPSKWDMCHTNRIINRNIWRRSLSRNVWYIIETNASTCLHWCMGMFNEMSTTLYGSYPNTSSSTLNIVIYNCAVSSRFKNFLVEIGIALLLYSNINIYIYRSQYLNNDQKTEISKIVSLLPKIVR